ncbi:MAG: ornithine cyclodeaminase family protein [Steroidobacteraceae bacterium]
MRAIPLRLIPAHVVRQLLDYPSCVEVLRAVMPKVSAGKALLPLRQGLPLPDGKGVLGMMPGALDGEPGWFGIKLVSLFPGNTARGLSSHLGMYALYEAETGQPLALLEAGGLTAIRTAAASVVATQALARDDARTLLVVGAGEQAEHHLRAFAAVRPFETVRIWARRIEAARQLANRLAEDSLCEVEVFESIDAAMEGSDVICTVTSSRDPLLTGALLQPGMHLCLVGASFPDRREVDDEVVVRSRFFVDYRGSAFAQAGELLHAIEAGRIDRSHVAAEIGEVLAGKVRGRTSLEEITVYKSLGIAAQDLTAAQLVYARACQVGSGIEITL